jgi:hypothetical protein
MDYPSLNDARAWLAELDQSVADGDLTQYRARCAVLKVALAGDQPPEVIQLFEEYMQCS